MSTKTKSVFSGMGGLIAAVAGLVTVAVGALSIGSALGWFGGDDPKSSKPGTEATSGADGEATGGPGSPASQSAATPEWDTDPSSVDFGISTEKIVTLTNTGEEPFAVGRPAIGGTDRGEFRADNVDCSSSLPAGGSCEVKVRFVPEAGGTYTAKLTVPLAGGESVAEVPLKAVKIL